MKIAKIIIISFICVLLTSNIAEASILGQFWGTISDYLGNLFGDCGKCGVDYPWEDVGCGVDCSSDKKMRQVCDRGNDCTPQYAYRCIDDSSCGNCECTGSDWVDVGCDQGQCAGTGKMLQKCYIPGCNVRYNCVTKSECEGSEEDDDTCDGYCCISSKVCEKEGTGDCSGTSKCCYASWACKSNCENSGYYCCDEDECSDTLNSYACTSSSKVCCKTKCGGGGGGGDDDEEKKSCTDMGYWGSKSSCEKYGGPERTECGSECVNCFEEGAMNNPPDCEGSCYWCKDRAPCASWCTKDTCSDSGCWECSFCHGSECKKSTTKDDVCDPTYWTSGDKTGCFCWKRFCEGCTVSGDPEKGAEMCESEAGCQRQGTDSYCWAGYISSANNWKECEEKCGSDCSGGGGGGDDDEERETECGDEIDNDKDGKSDCLDIDCGQNNACCTNNYGYCYYFSTGCKNGCCARESGSLCKNGEGTCKTECGSGGTDLDPNGNGLYDCCEGDGDTEIKSCEDTDYPFSNLDTCKEYCGGDPCEKEYFDPPGIDCYGCKEGGGEEEENECTKNGKQCCDECAEGKELDEYTCTDSSKVCCEECKEEETEEEEDKCSDINNWKYHGKQDDDACKEYCNKESMYGCSLYSSKDKCDICPPEIGGTPNYYNKEYWCCETFSSCWETTPSEERLVLCDDGEVWDVYKYHIRREGTDIDLECGDECKDKEGYCTLAVGLSGRHYCLIKNKKSECFDWSSPKTMNDRRDCEDNTNYKFEVVAYKMPYSDKVGVQKYCEEQCRSKTEDGYCDFDVSWVNWYCYIKKEEVEDFGIEINEMQPPGENNAEIIGNVNDCLIIITNNEGEPLKEPIVQNCRKEILFETQSEGKVLIRVLSFDPTIKLIKKYIDIEEIFMLTPYVCFVNQECQFVVNGCGSGTFILSNQKNNNPLQNNIIENINSNPFSYTITPIESGQISVKAICTESEVKIMFETIDVLE